MKRLRLTALAVLVGGAALGSQAAVVLSGTVRDFCAPAIANVCSQLSDFEGPTPGVVTGMVEASLVGGLPVAGANIVAGGSSAANFAQWYTDVAGVNQAIATTLTLTDEGNGFYSYSSNDFFPADGLGFGDQGRAHNYHFTLHLEGQLAFSDPSDAADRLFSFTGDDDLWIFVDGKLVLDLGGVHGAASGSFTEETLKSLGLVAGTAYDLDIFFAERHTTQSNFSIRTSLDITPPTPLPVPGTLALTATALLGLALARRRRG